VIRWVSCWGNRLVVLFAGLVKLAGSPCILRRARRLLCTGRTLGGSCGFPSMMQRKTMVLSVSARLVIQENM
jgi:hypothetical protein